MKSKLPLVVSLLMGLIAVLIVFKAFNALKTTLNVKMRPIIVAARDLREGEILGAGTYGEVGYPLRSPVGDLIEKYQAGPNGLPTDKLENRFVGQKLKNAIKGGTPIKWTDLEVGREESLSRKVPPGYRAVTIPVDDVGGVAGLVRVGDRVDILGNFDVSRPSGAVSEESQRYSPYLSDAPTIKTITLLQDVTVLATGQSFKERIAGRGSEGGGYSNITILMTPQECQMVVYCIQRATLSLTLRNPKDSGPDSIVEFTPQEQQFEEEDILDQLVSVFLTEQRKQAMVANRSAGMIIYEAGELLK